MIATSINNNAAVRIAGRQLQVMTLIYATGLTLIINILPITKAVQYIPFYFLISVGILFFLLLFHEKIYALVFLLLIAIVFEERPPTLELFVSDITNYSLWTFNIGSVNSVNILILFLIGYSLCFIYLFSNRPVIITRETLYLIIIIFCFVVFAVINGVIHGNEFRFLFSDRDLQRDLYVLFGLTIAVLFIRSKRDINIIIHWMIIILSMVLSVGLYRLISGIGMKWGALLRLFLSATPLLLAYPFSSFLTILCTKHYKSRLQKWLLMLLLLLTAFVCFVQLGRTVWLLLMFTFVFLIVFLPKKARNTLLKYTLVIILVAVILLAIYEPRIFKGLFVRLCSIFNWDVSGFHSSFSNAVKRIEVINVFHNLANSNDLLWGKGYGCYWTHEYMTLPKISAVALAASYEPGESEHRTTHIYLLNRILKWGLSGTVLYIGFVLTLLVKSIKKLKSFIAKDRVYAFVFGMIPVLLFMTLENSFARPFLIYGLMLGLLFRTLELTFSENELCPVEQL